VVAVGTTFVLISGGLDLSVGSIYGFSGGVAGLALIAGWPIAASILAGLAAGAFVGLVNGIVVTQAKVPSVIVTLGMLFIVRGLVLVFSGGAPIYPLPDSFLEEARILAGERSDDPEKLAERILARGARSVVITLGAEGAFVRDPHAGVQTRVPTKRFDGVVDTSGAGDAFNGALAWTIAGGLEIVEAVRFACAAAAVITQGPGLIDSLHLWDGVSRPEPMARKALR
jgi:hypothetical protein